MRKALFLMISAGMIALTGSPAFAWEAVRERTVVQPGIVLAPIINIGPVHRVIEDDNCSRDRVIVVRKRERPRHRRHHHHQQELIVIRR